MNDIILESWCYNHLLFSPTNGGLLSFQLMHCYLPANYNTTMKNNLMGTFKLAFIGEVAKDRNVSIGMSLKQWYIIYSLQLWSINGWSKNNSHFYNYSSIFINFLMQLEQNHVAVGGMSMFTHVLQLCVNSWSIYWYLL